MKHNIFVKYIKNRFFNKIVLLYSIILICTISALVLIIITSISDILKRNAIDYNSQVIKVVDSYFDRQCVNFKSDLQSLYIQRDSLANKNTYEKNLAGLLTGSGLFSLDYINKYSSVYTYFGSTFMPSDNMIKDIFAINNDFSWNMRISRNSSTKEVDNRYSAIEKFIKNNKFTSINDKKIRIIPAFAPSANGKYTAYSVYDYIRDDNGSGSSCGYLAFTFDLEGIRQSYQQFDKYLVGSILIITPEGKVIYDSSGKCYDKIFPYTDKLSAYNGSIDSENCIINYDCDSTFDFITVGVLPYDVINKSVTILNSKIIITSLVCLTCIILLTSLISKLFSKRVLNVVDTIKEIQKGNFSARANLQSEEDEIQVIARNINIMSEKISEYIKREYISELHRKDAELKQKTAQLYALQVQVDPHFLYNTLEAIRMKAVSVGDGDTGEMIKILARLFRSSLKNGMIVTIKEELQYCEYYLELINIRFGDYIQIIYNVDPEIELYAIPKYVMQPIVENAIVHGSGVSNGNNTINISGSMNNGDIFLSVKDTGKGITEQELQQINKELENSQNIKSEKIGIYNVNSRIKLIFGDKYGLKIYSKFGEGTEVVITIKAVKKEDLPKNVQDIVG